MKLDSIPPRHLRYRNHFKLYVLGLSLLAFLFLSFWGLKIHAEGLSSVYQLELLLSGGFVFSCFVFYFLWIRPKFNRSIQVFSDHLLLHQGKVKQVVNFNDIDAIKIVGWSIFYIKVKNGMKFYFTSGFERVDYVWEGIHGARPDLFEKDSFEAYRLKLVQYDHHQKRKEWFFKHKMIDVFNWTILPVTFLFMTYYVQSKSIVIHQPGLYFFRLMMFALLVLLSTAFLYSLVLKKLVFDRSLTNKPDHSEYKIRDVEFEGIVLQRSKLFQLMTAAFILGVLVKLDVNLYSISKVKEDIASFKLHKGRTILIDNRYNCLGCKYQLEDGDFVVFGRGVIGQILAKEGDMVGQIAQDKSGRMIASENVQEVPRGHVAIKAANGKDIVFVKLEELVGKVQN